MSTLLRKDLPTLLIAFVGFAIVAEWFFPIQALSDFKSYLGLCVTIIYRVSIGIGTVYATTSEYAVWRRDKSLQQTIISGSMFAMIIIMALVCVLYGGLEAGYKPQYKWFQYNIYQPQSQAMYAVMFLFQCGSLYRVCRARSMESTILLVAGGIFILSCIPLFSSFVPGIAELGTFVTQGPSLGGTRPANMAAAIGAIIVGLRSLLGKEQSTMETD
ncbi:hypothetical protein ES703_14768 [subsurface metagenome]